VALGQDTGPSPPVRPGGDTSEGVSPTPPTATQAVEVGQETPVSVVSPDGDGSIAHDVPFHDSATASPSAWPTATQLTGPEQEMASNRLDFAPAGLTGAS
jgi:hypothetical protein